MVDTPAIAPLMGQAPAVLPGLASGGAAVAAKAADVLSDSAKHVEAAGANVVESAKAGVAAVVSSIARVGEGKASAPVVTSNAVATSKAVVPQRTPPSHAAAGHAGGVKRILPSHRKGDEVAHAATAKASAAAASTSTAAKATAATAATAATHTAAATQAAAAKMRGITNAVKEPSPGLVSGTSATNSFAARLAQCDRFRWHEWLAKQACIRDVCNGHWGKDGCPAGVVDDVYSKP